MVRQLRSLKDAALADRLTAIWGVMRETSPDMTAEVERVKRLYWAGGSQPGERVQVVGFAVRPQVGPPPNVLRGPAYNDGHAEAASSVSRLAPQGLGLRLNRLEININITSTGKT